MTVARTWGVECWQRWGKGLANRSNGWLMGMSAKSPPRTFPSRAAARSAAGKWRARRKSRPSRWCAQQVKIDVRAEVIGR